MCCQILKCQQHHLAPISMAADAAASLLTEPQAAAGILSFLHIQPDHVFKEKLSLTITIFSRFSHFISVCKIQLKSLKKVYMFLWTTYHSPLNVDNSAL